MSMVCENFCETFQYLEEQHFGLLLQNTLYTFKRRGHTVIGNTNMKQLICVEINFYFVLIISTSIFRVYFVNLQW